MSEADPPGPIAALVLAAGLGARFRREDASVATKLVAPLAGKPLVRHAAEAAVASRARPVIVVTGHAAETVRAALDGLPLRFADNRAFETGLASSLRTGLAAIPDACAGALVLLGDMPRVTPQILDGLIEAFARAPDAAAVVPTYAGARGNPVLLSRRLFPSIEALQGDQGARPLLEAAGAAVVEWPGDPSIAFDVDTPQQLPRDVAAGEPT